LIAGSTVGRPDALERQQLARRRAPGEAMGARRIRGGFTHEQHGAPVEWYTPPEIFTALGLAFDLDPCSPPGGLPWVPASTHFDKSHDGLARPWHGRVWVNPPYDRETGNWLRRFVEHQHGVALVFARVDTKWFHSIAARIDAACFIAGRLRFVRADGSPGKPAPAPSMLLACGDECAAALTACGLGFVMRPARGGR
jgi:DNA N-6-adenine-methyltransferase Dam